jgi:glycosyltransferase involved in cell wall biosynthesis
MKICLGISRLKSDLTEAISKNFYNLSEELVKQGEEVIAISPVKIKSPMNSKLIVYSKNHHYKSKSKIFSNVKNLGKFIKKNENNFDIFHMHLGFLFEAYLLSRIIKNVKKPIIITIWQPYMNLKEFFNFKVLFTKPKDYLMHFIFNSFITAPFFGNQIKNKYNRIVVSTKYQKQQLIKFIPNDKIKIIPNGLKDSEKQNKIKKESNSPRILYIGHFTQLKGTDSLIKSIPYIKKIFPDVKLTLAWSGYGSKNKILKIINKLKVKDNIIFKNKVKVYEELSQNDFLVVPYRFPLGTSHYHNVLVEALATGTPIFSSKIGSIPELITPGETGIFINPNKPMDIAKKLVNVFNNKKLKENISKKSIELFQKKFLLKNVAKTHIEMYNE